MRGTLENRQEALVDLDLLEARILEVLRNCSGHGRLSQIADGVGAEPVTVNGALAAMERKRLVRQAGPWWHLTPRGERLLPEDGGDGATVRAPRKAAGVRQQASANGAVDYAAVLEDLRRRRDALDAAIAAIEQLEA